MGGAFGPGHDLLVVRPGQPTAPDEIANTFEEWNRGDLQSFLIEITAGIVRFPDDQGAEGILLDHILDVVHEAIIDVTESDA